MKKVDFLMIITLFVISVNSNAQLNYLFSTSSRPYVSLKGGTAPHLIMVPPSNANPPWTLFDEGFAQVPIGFKFDYNGKNYDSATICANGFVTLGDTVYRRLSPLRLYQNSLARGPFPVEGIKPVLAPFWDDLDIVDTLNLVYKTTGYFPFRVFTVEWKKTKWTFESTAPALSMQLKLYETTNIIEFHYKDEGGTPFTERAFASIGITSSYNNRGFISLQDASTHPSISLLRAMDSLTSKPANNQVYRFTPALSRIPDFLHNTIKFTNNKVSFKLNSAGPRSYEYAITSSPIPPLSGNRTSLSNVTVSSLSPATTYYIYARSKLLGSLYSQWTCDSFTTAVNPVALPYHVGGDPAIYPYLPADMRIQEIKDTAFHYSPNSDINWNVIVDFPDIGDTSLWSLANLYGFTPDGWVFTPGLKLNAGKTYQLKFGYLSWSSQDVPGQISSLEVKYGRATGAAGMTSGTLFKRTDIVTDLNEDGWIDFTDTTIEISPDHSGVYYFGFRNLTEFTGIPGPVPVIGNISIAEKTTTAEVPFTLAGRTISTDNILSWKIKDNKTNTGFEVQRSIDGINFKKIGNVASNIISTSKNHTILRIDRNTAVETNNKYKPDVFEDKPHFELQRMDDHMNFVKAYPLTNETNTSLKDKINYDYIDRNIEGINYYRLQHTNKNGKLTYSNIVKLDATVNLRITNIYPNPAKDVLNISIVSIYAAKLNMIVTDASGKIVVNKPVELISGKGINYIQLPVSNLSGGAYTIKLTTINGSENAVIKFIKQ